MAAPPSMQLWTAHAPRPRRHRRDDWFGAGGPVLSHDSPPAWSHVKTGTRRRGSPQRALQGIPDPWLSRTWKTDAPFKSGQWRETESSFYRDDEDYWTYGDNDDFDNVDGGAISNVPSLAHAWE